MTLLVSFARKADYKNDNALKGEATVKTKQEIASVSFASSTLAYSGKTLVPKVAVKDKNGKLVAPENYKVSGAGKSVGRYTLTVTGINTAEGKVSKTYKIVPKKTAITKLKKGRKSFKAYWKKQGKSTATGYQVQYSLKKSFSKAKTSTVKSYKTSSRAVKKLKAKKTYYVRVRVYKSVKGAKYYSAWSSAKKVKTK